MTNIVLYQFLPNNVSSGLHLPTTKTYLFSVKIILLDLDHVSNLSNSLYFNLNSQCIIARLQPPVTHTCKYLLALLVHRTVCSFIFLSSNTALTSPHTPRERLQQRRIRWDALMLTVKAFLSELSSQIGLSGFICCLWQLLFREAGM